MIHGSCLCGGVQFEITNVLMRPRSEPDPVLHVLQPDPVLPHPVLPTPFFPRSSRPRSSPFFP